MIPNEILIKKVDVENINRLEKIEILENGNLTKELRKNKYLDIKLKEKVFKKKKLLSYNFNSFYGVGEKRISYFSKHFGLNSRFRTNRVNIKFKVRVNFKKLIFNFTYQNTLKKILLKFRKFSTETLRNYKGIRHSFRYPVRGQRTHTNSKTRKRLSKTNLKCFS